MMNERGRRKIMDILRVLSEADRPLGGTRIAQALHLSGQDMSQRTVRYYLEHTDQMGFTEFLGRRGRQLTARGRLEVENAFAVDKVGFVATQVDTLTYRMKFRLRQAKGLVVINVSTVEVGHISQAAALMADVFKAGLTMGNRLKIFNPNTRLGKMKLGSDHFGVATLCSVNLNGVLLAHGIPTNNRFGGLLQMEDGKPVRFTQFIHYDGTTLDPLEIFIKSRMTEVHTASQTGNGMVGASFREIPAPGVEKTRQLSARMQRVGLAGPIWVGRPGQSLLEIPVSPGRVGLAILGGLNPLAAAEELGLATTNHALNTMIPFEELLPYEQALAPYL